MPGRTDSTRAVAITPPKPALKILSRARSGWFKYLFLAVDASTSLPALPDGENNDKERTRNPWEQGLSWCGAKMDHLPWLSQTKSTISSLRAPVVQLNKNISTSGCCLESDNRMFSKELPPTGRRRKNTQRLIKSRKKQEKERRCSVVNKSPNKIPIE